jgi:hypothetical protein
VLPGQGPQHHFSRFLLFKNHFRALRSARVGGAKFGTASSGHSSAAAADLGAALKAACALRSEH